MFTKKSRGSRHVAIRSCQCPILMIKGLIPHKGLLMALFKGHIMTTEAGQHFKALFKSSPWKKHQKRVLTTSQPSEAAEAGVGFQEVRVRYLP